MIFEQRVPVLVSEDTIFRREDHSKRLLLYGRPPLPGQPFNRLYPPRPAASLFYDTFVSVYSTQEAISPIAVASVPTGHPQPSFLLYQSPPPSVFFDTFASVCAKQEAFWQVTPQTVSPPQPRVLYLTKNRARAEG